jgi:hypothetical protein
LVLPVVWRTNHFLFGNKAGIAFSLEASKYLPPRFYMVTSIHFNMVPYDFPDVMHKSGSAKYSISEFLPFASDQ